MFRTIKDINTTFFPLLDETIETWKIIYDKYEISSYGRLRVKNSGSIINPSDAGIYTVTYKFSPKYIKISDYVIIPEPVKPVEVEIDLIPVTLEVVSVSPKKKYANKNSKKKKG